MECKNCARPMRSDHSYCSNCGAKVIRNPLTIKNLWYDITERYFNVDNTFLKTFWHLFSKPDVVIEGYINGVRKKYLNPISYYGIALTLTGLLFFFIREFFMEQTSLEWMTSGSNSSSVGEETFDNTIKYQSIISVLSIPLYALFSKIIFFRNKKHNYTGHIIINLYLLSQYTVASFSVYLILLTLGFNYMKITYIGLLFYMLYTAYGLKKIFKMSIGRMIWKTFLFLLLLIVLFIASTIFILLFTYMTEGVEGLKNMGTT